MQSGAIPYRTACDRDHTCTDNFSHGGPPGGGLLLSVVAGDDVELSYAGNTACLHADCWPGFCVHKVPHNKRHPACQEARPTAQMRAILCPCSSVHVAMSQDMPQTRMRYSRKYALVCTCAAEI